MYGVAATQGCHQGDRVTAKVFKLASVAADVYAQQKSVTGLYGSTELTKSTNYDFVLEFSGSSSSQTIYNMGEAEGSLPADVLACRPGGNSAYVDGAEGSYAVDTSKLVGMYIFVDDLVSAAGGGGGLALPPIGGGIID